MGSAQLLLDCLDEVGLRNAEVEHGPVANRLADREGDFPSPSITIGGTDVMGAPTDAMASCRLDLPTRERVLAALRGE
jgi:hypothetical protein